MICGIKDNSREFIKKEIRKYLYIKLRTVYVRVILIKNKQVWYKQGNRRYDMKLNEKIENNLNYIIMLSY